MSVWPNIDWFSASENNKKPHGLFNQGATCYLNSVLQVLFMTKGFREAVERHACENPGTLECLDCQLKSLFTDLNERTACTDGITKSLGIKRVCEQQDAAEYFEKILTRSSPEASQIFHGQLTHETECSGCHTQTNTDGQFWHLSLEWVYSHKETYSVVDGINEYFKVSHFSGEDQMYCDQCDAKSDATVRYVIKHHPESLMLLLKRFDFDYRYMMNVKNNHVVDVPCTLQIPENQMYELYAVVEHSGNLRGGHYSATIKSQDSDLWYNLDDTRVTSLFQVPDTQRSQSVYLLFYKKKKTDAADVCTQDVINGGFTPTTGEKYDQCQGAEQIREREDDKETAEVHFDITVAASIDRNEETASGNVDSVEPPNNPVEWNEDRSELCGYRQDAHAENWHRGDSERITEEERRDERGPLPAVTPLEEPEQEDRHDFSTQPVSEDKKRDEEMTRDVKGAEEEKSGKRVLLTKYDLYLQGLQDNSRVGDSTKNREERRQVDGDMEEKRWGDRKEASTKVMKPYHHDGAEYQDKRRLHDVRQNRAKQKISDMHTRHEEVSVIGQTNKQEETGHEHEIRQDRKRRDGSVEKMKRGDSQSKETAELSLKSDPKTHAKGSLTEGVDKIDLNESHLPERSRAKIKESKKIRLRLLKFSLKKDRKKKKNAWKKYASCLPLPCKNKKFVGQSSESD